MRYTGTGTKFSNLILSTKFSTKFSTVKFTSSTVAESLHAAALYDTVPLCNRKHEKINSIHKLQLLFDCNFDSATSIGSGRNADLRNTSSHTNFWADTRKPIRFGGNYKQMFKSVWIKAA